MTPSASLDLRSFRRRQVYPLHREPVHWESDPLRASSVTREEIVEQTHAML
jgi:hypothetical protein